LGAQKMGRTCRRNILGKGGDPKKRKYSLKEVAKTQKSREDEKYATRKGKGKLQSPSVQKEKN